MVAAGSPIPPDAARSLGNSSPRSTERLTVACPWPGSRRPPERQRGERPPRGRRGPAAVDRPLGRRPWRDLCRRGTLDRRRGRSGGGPEQRRPAHASESRARALVRLDGAPGPVRVPWWSCVVEPVHGELGDPRRGAGHRLRDRRRRGRRGPRQRSGHGRRPDDHGRAVGLGAGAGPRSRHQPWRRADRRRPGVDLPGPGGSRPSCWTSPGAGGRSGSPPRSPFTPASTSARTARAAPATTRRTSCTRVRRASASPTARCTPCTPPGAATTPTTPSRYFTGERLLGGGELLMTGEIVLARDETYESPWVYAAYGVGLDEVAHRFHATSGPDEPGVSTPPAGHAQRLGGGLLRPRRRAAARPGRAGRGARRGALRPR